VQEMVDCSKVPPLDELELRPRALLYRSRMLLGFRPSVLVISGLEARIGMWTLLGALLLPQAWRWKSHRRQRGQP
jgi:hypothetical protein